MNKEVELTARLEKREYDRLKKYLNKNCKKFASQKRFMIRFFKNRVNVRESLDIRYKWTNGVNELVVKKGALGTQSRQEIIVNLGKENQLDHFVHFFRLLGYSTANAIYREIEKYRTDRVEAALVIGYPYYFLEVESLGARTKTEALEEVNKFFNKVGLTPLNRSDYQSFQRLFDRRVNLIFPIDKFPKPLLENPYWKKVVEETVFSTR